MSTRTPFGWATTGARVLVGTLVSAGFVVAVVSAISVPWPTIAREPAAVEVSPTATDSILACTGDLLAIGRDLADANRVTAAAGQQVAVATAGGIDAVRDTLEGPAEGSGPAVVSAPAVDGVAPDLAAAGSASVDSDDLSGLAASACRPALMESWLVGGSGSTGAADLVLLSNPGEVAATVELTVYGADGAATPAGSGLVLPAGTQRAIPLAGLVLGEESPVVRVTSTGAPVQASLQASITRTLEPGGVDQVGAIAAATAEAVIPAVPVGGGDGEDAATVVRILAPDTATEARVTVVADGDDAPAADPQTVPLTAGVPTEVELRGLAAGRYTVTVEADVPVLAAVWQTTGFGEGSDFGWFTAAPAYTGPSLLATPPGGQPTLTVVNPQAEPVAVRVQPSAGGDAVELQLAPGQTLSTALAAGTGYVLDSGGAEVHAAVTVASPAGIAGFAVWASDAAAPAIAVYP
ncbi:DUF5719 family protein [Microbacterium fluvii]|uniref:DUF5719 family protein n=1 Tax=Microbacterium fluvii TaxID=415215 RepID=A0ABW2H8Y4_9MICO|nr:DUF5719 family protein [Microbacterium fluvii]MCU4671442.1 DUF5719 family protein [Microbacterium fluvii]